MSWAALSSTTVSVLATFALHSTVCYALGLGFSRVRFLRSDRERLGKLLLVLPFLSTAVGVACTLTPAGDTSVFSAWSPLPEPGAHALLWRVVVGAVLVGWVAIASVLVLRVARTQRRVARFLSGRKPIDIDRTPTWILEATGGESSGVRVTVHRDLSTPVALRGREICLPRRFLPQLRKSEFRALLLHEVAHLHARDPRWFLLFGVLDAVAFFQPLTGRLTRELRQLAELRCDAASVVEVGSALPLSRCLAKLAEWHRERRVVVGGLATLGVEPSTLEARVLAAFDQESRVAPSAPRIRWGAALTRLAALSVFFLPAVTIAVPADPREHGSGIPKTSAPSRASLPADPPADRGEAPSGRRWRPSDRVAEMLRAQQEQHERFRDEFESRVEAARARQRAFLQDFIDRRSERAPGGLSPPD